jgi:hypothetical protein
MPSGTVEKETVHPSCLRHRQTWETHCQCPFPPSTGIPQPAVQPSETNRIHLVLVGMQNREFGPCLAAINSTCGRLVPGTHH